MIRVPSTFESSLCGWLVISDIFLPELCAWSGSTAEHVVRIRFDDAEPPPCLEFNAISPILAVGEHNVIRIKIPEVATYYVLSGKEIRIRPHSSAKESDIRLFLIGIALSALCHQRNVLPMLASCVSRNDETLLLVGPSCCGKSTFALQLLRQGYSILSAELTLVEYVGSKKFIAHPIDWDLRLHSDALKATGVDTKTLPKVRIGVGSVRYSPKETITEPRRLTRICVLNSMPVEKPGRPITIKCGVAAEGFYNSIDQKVTANALGKIDEIRKQVLELIETIPISRAQSSRGLTTLEADALAIIAGPEL